MKWKRLTKTVAMKMKRFLSEQKITAIRMRKPLLLGIIILVVVAFSIPLLLCWIFPVESSNWWMIATTWLVGTAAAGAITLMTWWEARTRRNEEILSSIALYIRLEPPGDQSNYGDSFQLSYENRGSRDLLAAVELFAYPCGEGRQDKLNPAFQDDYRDRVTSLGPFETHELVLAPRETQTFPYSHQVVLQSMGMHGYIPHWVTIRTHVSPREKPSLERQDDIIFHLLWFCGNNQPFPGRWHISRMRIRAERHYNSKPIYEKWRRELSDKIPDEYREENLQDFMDLRSR